MRGKDPTRASNYEHLDNLRDMFVGGDQVTLGLSPKNPSNQIYFPPYPTMTYCTCSTVPCWDDLKTRSQDRENVSVSEVSVIVLGLPHHKYAGTWWRSWLRHCTTSRKVAGSIPDGVIGIFH